MKSAWHVQGALGSWVPIGSRRFRYSAFQGNRGYVEVRGRYSLASRVSTSLRLSATAAASMIVLVEILVERARRHCEQSANMSPVTGFRPELADCDEMVSVSDVFPAAVFGDGLEHLDTGAPPLLGC